MGRVGGYWAGKLPGNTEHEGIFPEDTEVVDIFAPPRKISSLACAVAVRNRRRLVAK
jgi:hypothetical protein